MATEDEIRQMAEQCVDDQQRWVEALILEKLGFNWGQESLASQGVHPITFPNPYASGVDVNEIDIRPKVFNADGEEIGYELVSGSKTNTGFQVWVSGACTFDYIAYQPKTLIPL